MTFSSLQRLFVLRDGSVAFSRPTFNKYRALLEELEVVLLAEQISKLMSEDDDLRQCIMGLPKAPMLDERQPNENELQHAGRALKQVGVR